MGIRPYYPFLLPKIKLCKIVWTDRRNKWLDNHLIQAYWSQRNGAKFYLLWCVVIFINA